MRCAGIVCSVAGPHEWRLNQRLPEGNFVHKKMGFEKFSEERGIEPNGRWRKLELRRQVRSEGGPSEREAERGTLERWPQILEHFRKSPERSRQILEPFPQALPLFPRFSWRTWIPFTERMGTGKRISPYPTS